MKVSWRSSTPEEVTEIDAGGNPVPSSLTPAEDLALRTAALGLCEYCGGPLTEIWSAGWSRSRNTVTYAGGGNSTASLSGGGIVAAPGGGGGGGSCPSPESESWRFCSKDHMDAFLADAGHA